MLTCRHTNLLVLNLQHYDLKKQCHKSTAIQQCHSKCYDGTVGKALHRFLYGHLEDLPCAWPCIHTCTAMFARTACTQHYQPFRNNLICHVPPRHRVVFCLPVLSFLPQKNKLRLICQCPLICSRTVFCSTSLQLRLPGWVG